MFMLLNIISGFLETGAVIFALGHYGIKGALFAALLYHVGNLVPSPIKLSRLPVSVISVVATLLMIVGSIYPIGVIIAIPLLSATLQSVMSKMNTTAKKMLKRISRTVGFSLGFSFIPIFGIAVAVIVLICVLRCQSQNKTQFVFPKFGKLQVVMVLHQMHYFVYCYAVMVIDYQFGGALLATGLFFAGWIMYALVPLLYQKSKNYKRIFILGHTLLVIILLSMLMVDSFPLMALLWLMTGFGGTTEFCIGRLEKQQGTYSDDKQICAENVGHILGVAVCLVAFLITQNLYLSPLYAAIFAAMAIIIMTLVKKVNV